jgi:hypothetical protein
LSCSGGGEFRRHRGSQAYTRFVRRPGELFLPDEAPFEQPADDALVRSIELELGVTLPEAYISLSRIHNGGILAKTAHPTSTPTSWAKGHVAVYSLAAIGRTAEFSLCGEVGSKFWVEEWGYPDIGVYFADCPSAGHDMLALDYSAPGEPRVVHIDQETGYRITLVAPDFGTFLTGLVDEDEFPDGDP